MEMKKIFAYPQLIFGYIYAWLITIVFEVIAIVCFNAIGEWLLLFPVFVAVALMLFIVFNFFKFSKMLKRLELNQNGIKYKNGKKQILWKEITNIKKESVFIGVLSKIPNNIIENKTRITGFSSVEIRPYVHVYDRCGNHVWLSMSDENMLFLTEFARGKSELIDDLIEYYTEKKENGELPPHWEEVGLFKK